MTGARPTGSGISSRVRVELFLAALVSSFLIASPASALLGELIDGVIDPPIEALSDLPLTEPIIEDVVEPVLTVLEPVVETIDPGETVDPIVDVPPLAPTEGDPSVVNTATGNSGGSLSSQEKFNEILPEPNATLAIVLGVRDRGLTGLERSLLDSDPAGALTGSIDVPAASTWLSRLAGWLPSSLAGLVGILAIPLQLIELLLRALLSAGSGLVAPTSLLLALVFVMLVDRHPTSIVSLRREVRSFSTRFAHGIR